MKGHHMAGEYMLKGCLFWLVYIKPDTPLLRQPGQLTYSLIRESTK